MKEKESELLESAISTEPLLTSKGTDVYNFIGDDLKTVRTFIADLDKDGKEELIALLCSNDSTVIKKYHVENGEIIETEMGTIPKTEYCECVDAILFYNESLGKYCISWSSYGVGAYTGAVYFYIELYTLENDSIVEQKKWHWNKQFTDISETENVKAELIENNIPYMNVSYLSFDNLSECKSYAWLMHTNVKITDGSIPTYYTRYMTFDSNDELNKKSNFSIEISEVSDAEKFSQVVLNNSSLYENDLYNSCDQAARSVDVCFFDIDLDGDLEFVTFHRTLRNKTYMDVYDVDVSKNLLKSKRIDNYYYIIDSDYDIDMYMDNNNEIFYIGTDLQEIGETRNDYPYDTIDKTCEIIEKAFKFEGNELVTKNLFKIFCKDESAIGQNEIDKFYYFADDDTPVEVSFEEYNSRVKAYYSSLTNLNLEYKFLDALKEFTEYYWLKEEKRYVYLTEEERKNFLIESYNAFKYDTPDVIPETTTTTTTTETTVTTTETTVTTTENTTPLNPTSSGTCGENAVWEYDEESKTLIISGSGDMYDYSIDKESPWDDLFDNIEKIVIEKGITRIGDNAFHAMLNMETVDIPNTVKSIGKYAFYACWALKSVNIPYGVETIEEDAFSSNHKITSLKLPNTIKKVGEFAFSGCNHLETVYIPESVSTIDFAAFAFCDNLKSITIANKDCEIYDNESTISETATIYGKEGSTAQAFAEKYNRTFVVLENAEVILGDVNGDEHTDATDASIVLAEYAILSTGGESEFTEEQRKAADVDNNDIVDASDASLILAFYAYLSTGGEISDMKVWLETQ